MADRRVAIVQSNYIPWKGYFDLLNSVDEFILLDSVQYTRRDWRNRNLIKTPRGLHWLTIPVHVKGRYLQAIDETRISDADWGRKHLASLRHSYRRAPFFAEYEAFLAHLYETTTTDSLSEVNERFLTAICGVLGIATKISRARRSEGTQPPTERLVSLCRHAAARRYLSGPAARAYIDERRFAEAGIAVDWMDYSGYPEYPQLYPPFEHRVSIVDLLVHVGPKAPDYLKSFVKRDPAGSGPGTA